MRRLVISFLEFFFGNYYPHLAVDVKTAEVSMALKGFSGTTIDQLVNIVIYFI